MKKLAIMAAAALLACACNQADPALPCVGSFADTEFATPPMKCRPVPLWFWNNTEVDSEGVVHQLHQMIEKDGYGGCAILPFGKAFKPEYLGEEYMKLYALAESVADSLGAQMSLYDEYGFPSGSIGYGNGDGVTRFRNAHPGRTLKRLDKHETAVECGAAVELDLNALQGKLMAVAAYDAAGHKSESLRAFVKDGKLSWTAPDQGKWTVMVFECVDSGSPIVDYLDPDAVKLFVEDTHEKYYAEMAPAFGKIITSTFFDEPTMYRAEGRVWTEAFNDEFKARYNMEPDAFYPSLWYDLGESTPAVRNMMYGLHSALYAEGFMKVIAEWAEAHGIASTGHQDQEEIANTTCVSGDLMLDGKYMTMPGIDKIGGDRPAELYYKVVSSSAQNWDKTEVMSETYGAMGNIPVSEMYQIAIEQYTKGITNLIPHAVWYDDTKVTFLPELSWRNPLYNYALPDYTTFVGRLRYMLARPGRHVADIAMLYPVQTQYAGHHVDGELGPVVGGIKIEGTDYAEVSRLLTDELGRDFTYIHPEVLDDRCTVSGGKLRMHNKVNSEAFSVMILPGVKAISLSNMKQVMKAWRSGVKIVFTTQTPCESADYGVDNAVIAKMVDKILNHSGGKRSATFVADPERATLEAALEGTDADVQFNLDMPFNYIHKVFASDEGEVNVYLIGNIDPDAGHQEVSLKGEYTKVRLMDPHTGVCSDADFKTEGGRTVLTMDLDPDRATFILAQ